MPESSLPTVVSLMPHPAVAPGPVEALSVAPAWHAATRILALDYRLEVDPACLRLPAAAMPRRADGLWRHTCLEAFVQPAGQDGYLEFNFSPSGEWAAYRFDGRRSGMHPLSLPQDPVPRFTREPHGLALSVRLDLTGLPRVPLRLGLAAVIEAPDGTLGYWALRHGSGAPDFHDPESFTLRLDTHATGAKT